MKIAIAERLHPFSHQPKTVCVIPRSLWQVEVFPTLLRFYSLPDPHRSLELHLSLQGPFSEFTIELDLEKGAIVVFGRGVDGYLRYRVARESDGIQLFWDKLPKREIHCCLPSSQIKYCFKEKELFLLPLKLDEPEVPLSTERLSLGMHKAQDWDLVQRRKDLREIFPGWMRLGQMIPFVPSQAATGGTMTLLRNCEGMIERKDRLHVLEEFSRLFQTAFQGILSPQLADLFHQGILSDEEVIPSGLSPSLLLSEGAQVIRSLFFQERKNEWEFLPCLPSSFDAGRLVDLLTEERDRVALEWSKHLLKKVIIFPSQKKQVVLSFPKATSSFRFRRALKERGKRVNLKEGKVEIHLDPSSPFYLDRFEK